MTADPWSDEPVAEPVPPLLGAELRTAAADYLASGQDARTWLDERWTALDQDDPIVDIDVNFTYFEELGLEPRNVDFRQLARVDEENRWGQVNNRPESYELILDGLGQAHLRDSLDAWVHEMGAPELLELPGPYGSLYEVSSDGRHRAHVLRALGVSLFPALVDLRAPAVSPGSEVYIAPPTQFRVHPADAARAGSAHRRALQRHSEHIGVLVEHAVIRPMGEEDHYEVLRDMPAAWALEHPEDAVRISRRYRRSFPEFGEASEGEWALSSGQEWLSYLERTAPARPLAGAGLGSRRRWRWRLTSRR